MQLLGRGNTGQISQYLVAPDGTYVRVFRDHDFIKVSYGEYNQIIDIEPH